MDMSEAASIVPGSVRELLLPDLTEVYAAEIAAELDIMRDVVSQTNIERRTTPQLVTLITEGSQDWYAFVRGVAVHRLLAEHDLLDAYFETPETETATGWKVELQCPPHTKGGVFIVSHEVAQLAAGPQQQQRFRYRWAK